MRRNFGQTAWSALAALGLLFAGPAAWAGPGPGGEPCQIGKALADGTFVLDANGNGIWDGTAGGDIRVNVAVNAGDGAPVVGDWNGNGYTNVGKKIDEKFLIDLNGNNVWEGNSGGDRNKTFAGSTTGTVGVSGDFAMSNNDQIGKYQSSGSRFLLDTNGNGTWEGTAGGDFAITIAAGVSGTSQPVVGDFNGDGKDDTGKMVDGTERFFIDLNGNGTWDGNAGGDRARNFAANFSPSVPVTGNFGGTAETDEIGKYVPSNSTFYFDANGNGTWEGNAGGDRSVTLAASAGTGNGLICDWDNDGQDNGGRQVVDKYIVDLNGNNVWDGNAGGDRNKTFAGSASLTGGTGVTGTWGDDGM